MSSLLFKLSGEREYNVVAVGLTHMIAEWDRIANFFIKKFWKISSHVFYTSIVVRMDLCVLETISHQFRVFTVFKIMIIVSTSIDAFLLKTNIKITPFDETDVLPVI